MGESHIISALLTKREKIIGRVVYYKTKTKKLINNLDNIDKTIRMFEPNIELSVHRWRVYRKFSKHFKNGELSKLILDIMREKDKPIKIGEIAGIIKIRKGINDNLTKTIRATINTHRKNGNVIETGKNGYYNEKLWCLIE